MCDWSGEEGCGVCTEEGGEAVVEATEAGVSCSSSYGVRFRSGEVTPWSIMKSMPGDCGV